MEIISRFKTRIFYSKLTKLLYFVSNKNAIGNQKNDKIHVFSTFFVFFGHNNFEKYSTNR